LRFGREKVVEKQSGDLKAEPGLAFFSEDLASHGPHGACNAEAALRAARGERWY
jgi:hypothetical protein